MRNFVLSGKNRLEFWLISLNDLSIFEFEAVKAGRETVAIGDERFPAIHVRIKPLGWVGAFWQAHC